MAAQEGSRDHAQAGTFGTRAGAGSRRRGAHFKGAAPSGEVAAGAATRTSRDAPRSVPLDDTSSFPTITGNEGAVISNRENASQAASAARRDLKARTRGSHQLTHAARRNVQTRSTRTQTNKKLFVGMGVVALLIVLVVCFLFVRAAHSVSEVAETQAAAAAEKKVTSADQSVSYSGFTFSLQKQDDGSYHLIRTADSGSDPLDLATLPGTPVSIALFNGAILISENQADGTWNVVVYTAGDGSVVTSLTNADGSEVSGQGELVSARIDGDNLVLKDKSGQETSVKLTNLSAGR